MLHSTSPEVAHESIEVATPLPTTDQNPYSVLREKLRRFQTPEPVVSIVIPAYNEEKLLIRLLTSLADLETKYPTELIIANNNSTDSTQTMLNQCGVTSIFVRKQGVAHARQAGLEAARGTYIVNGDADCWYPPTWIDTLIAPLRDTAVTCTYGCIRFCRNSPRRG